MFSSAISDVMRANVFWPDLPYTTDELGSKMQNSFLLAYLLLTGVVAYSILEGSCVFPFYQISTFK